MWVCVWMSSRWWHQISIRSGSAGGETASVSSARGARGARRRRDEGFGAVLASGVAHGDESIFGSPRLISELRKMLCNLRVCSFSLEKRNRGTQKVLLS